MITAIIPCYNAERYLAEAIESVLRQTLRPEQIIVVDDCSTDKSRDVAARYPVTVLKTSINSGHATARNVGINSARGDFIAWLDADDYWLPHHIETMLALHARFSDADVLFSPTEMFGARVGVWGKASCELASKNVFWECFRKTVVPFNSVMTTTRSVHRVGKLNPNVRVAPDFDFWLRLSRQHKFASSPEPTSRYRWHKQQISNNPTRQWRSMYEARWRLLEEIRNEGDRELAVQIEKEMVRIWEEDLQKAYFRRNVQQVRFLLSLKSLLPGQTATIRRIRCRSYLPRFVFRLWDATVTRRGVTGHEPLR